MMRSQLLTSAMAMATISVAYAASGLGVEVETDRITDISFSKQAEGAMGLTLQDNESKQEENEEKAADAKGSDKPDTSRKESKDNLPSDFKPKSKRNSLSTSGLGSKSRSRSRKYSSEEWFVEGICDPDKTADDDLALCEDIWETICNPDDEVPVADDLCDWLGFTADVVWYDGEDLDYELEYAKIVPEEKSKKVLSSENGSSDSGSSDSKTTTKYHSPKNSRIGRFVEGMCDPDKSKRNEKDICNEVWDSLCNPDDEMEVDDDFCDWIGFTADVHWASSSVDYFEGEYDASDSYDSYDSEDRARKNLRG